MNNLSFARRILFLLLLGNVNVWAGLIAFPTGNAQWTATFAPKQSEAPATAAPANVKPTRKAQKIEVMQSNNLRRVRFTWNDGTTTEQWQIPDLPVLFAQSSGTQVYEILSGGKEAQIFNFYNPRDASAFDWLSSGDLVEKTPISYQGFECFHYRGTRMTLDRAATDNVAIPCEAWIDCKTLRPVAFDTGAALVTFVFDPKPPEDPMVPSANFANEIKSYKVIAGYR